MWKSLSLRERFTLLHLASGGGKQHWNHSHLNTFLGCRGQQPPQQQKHQGTQISGITCQSMHFLSSINSVWVEMCTQTNILRMAPHLPGWTVLWLLKNGDTSRELTEWHLAENNCTCKRRMGHLLGPPKSLWARRIKKPFRGKIKDTKDLHEKVWVNAQGFQVNFANVIHRLEILGNSGYM